MNLKTNKNKIEPSNLDPDKGKTSQLRTSRPREKLPAQPYL